MSQTPPRRPSVPVPVVRGRPQEVELATLRPNPFQPRLRSFEDDPGLAALVDDIRQHGFRGTIEVRRDPADPAAHPQVVAGHRRVEAAKRAGLTRVLAQFVEFTDDQMKQGAIRENLLREDLTPWEEAVFLQGLRNDGLSYDEAAAYCGKSVGWVQNRLRLLTLEGSLREAAMTEPQHLTVLNTLLAFEPAEREALFAQVKEGKLNVEDLRALVRAKRRTGSPEEASLPEGGGQLDTPVPKPETPPATPPDAPRRGLPPRRRPPTRERRPAPGAVPTPTGPEAAAVEALREILDHLEHLKRLLPFVDPARLSPEERRRIRDDLAEIVALWGRLLGEAA
jgi:ParB family chromosome partitioning protein